MKSDDVDDIGVLFQLNSNQTLASVYAEYAGRLDYDQSWIALVYTRVWYAPSATVGDVVGLLPYTCFMARGRVCL